MSASPRTGNRDEAAPRGKRGDRQGGSALRVLVVDDEPLARRRLSRLLTEIGGVEIVGQAGTVEVAREQLSRHRVDAIYLDIQLPGSDGFALLEDLRDPPPAVVFVTAFPVHAVRAFDVGARDYLLKPLDIERVARSVRRVRERLLEGAPDAFGAKVLQALVEKGAAGTGFRSRILVRSLGGVRFVPVEQVKWIEADGNYVRLHTSDGRLLARETMRRLESELDPKAFVRIHRSTIVNLAHVRELERHASGDHTLVLDSGERLTLSRTYRTTFERAIEGRAEEIDP